jgi:hypothetical protein
LNEAEEAKMAGLREELGVQVPLRVLERNEAASRNRIFGIGSQGAIYIREDIIAQGTHDQIKEAIDHENRELTSKSHDVIRQEQFQGDLTSLLKELSRQDRVGGIDFNPDNIKMEINKQNGGVKVEFDPKLLEEIRSQGIEGFVPIILNIQRVQSVVPLLSQNVNQPSENLVSI